MKLFFDANVIFSAPHRKEGRAQDLVALARGGRCELLTSTYALEEARRNLEIKSAGFDARLAETLAQTTIVGEARAGVVNWAQEQGLPLKDAPVLAAAVHAKADLLATGAARDFGHLFAHTTRGTRVVTLASAIGMVLKSAGA